MSYEVHYPEMTGEKTTGEITGYVTFGGRFMLKTKLELKGRGITYYSDNDLPDGRKTYCVTGRAFDKLSTQYDVVLEALL